MTSLYLELDEILALCAEGLAMGKDVRNGPHVDAYASKPRQGLGFKVEGRGLPYSGSGRLSGSGDTSRARSLAEFNADPGAIHKRPVASSSSSRPTQQKTYDQLMAELRQLHIRAGTFRGPVE